MAVGIFPSYLPDRMHVLLLGFEMVQTTLSSTCTCWGKY